MTNSEERKHLVKLCETISPPQIIIARNLFYTAAEKAEDSGKALFKHWPNVIKAIDALPDSDCAFYLAQEWVCVFSDILKEAITLCPISFEETP